MNINTVILGGNITRDIELEYTPSGTPVLTFGIAVNKHYTTSSGEKKERVLFADCRAWNNQAEVIAQYFSKGKPILVEGEMAQESWDDKETGKKRTKTLVLVNRFHFAGDNGKRREAPEEPEDRQKGRDMETRRRGEEERTPSGPMSRQLTDDDSDIPF